MNACKNADCPTYVGFGNVTSRSNGERLYQCTTCFRSLMTDKYSKYWQPQIRRSKTFNRLIRKPMEQGNMRWGKSWRPSILKTVQMLAAGSVWRASSTYQTISTPPPKIRVKLIKTWRPTIRQYFIANRAIRNPWQP